MAELKYHTLVWLAYRLAATFAVGLPLVILIWANIRKEASMVRLLSIYWKVASLMAISMLLLIDHRPLGYLTSFISPFLMVFSVWFWVDLNEELDDLPPWRPLPFTVRLWRWGLSGFGVLYATLAALSLPCVQIKEGANCLSWLGAPLGAHQTSATVFKFLFGANWSEPLAAFLGYIALIIYLVGILQWLLVRLPKQGRIAGEF